jgi:hypothetical protein
MTGHAAVAAAVRDLDLYGRWHGTYVIGHRDDATPEVIFFIGHSGD